MNKKIGPREGYSHNPFVDFCDEQPDFLRRWNFISA